MPEMPGIPRDGDGDGYIADGTPQMRPAPPRGAEPPSNAHLYPGVPAGVSVRRPGDAATIRTNTYARVEEAARSIQPVANVRHSIELSDVGWEGPASYTPSQVKQAKLEGRSLVRRLRGTWLLKDATDGRVVDAKRSTIAAVPIMNDDGSYTIGGTNYFLPGAQLRLKPGVYTRKKANGEFESHINALPGQGRAFRIFLEPDTGKMRVEVGQSATPLINMLKALGVKDAEVRSTLGDELAAINLATADSKALDRLHARMVPRGKESSPDGKAREIAEVLKATKLDPGVTAHTLGHPFETVDGAAVLAAAAKLKAVSRGEAPPDDRDHLAYMTAYGPEDLISERLRLVRAPLIRGLWKASREGSLRAFPNDVLGPAARGAILSSGIGQAGESINPLMDLDNRHRATRLGEGGIESSDSVPVESRAVQPSHLMYIDPLVSPECYDAQTDVMTRKGWVPWPEVTPETEFAVMVDDQVQWSRAEALHVSDYEGDLIAVDGARFAFAVTPNHRLWTRPHFRSTDANKPVYRFETADQSFGRPRRFWCGGFEPYVGDESIRTFTLPEVDRGSNAQHQIKPFPIEDWAELLGWYLSEGSFVYKTDPIYYRVDISQVKAVNQANHERIRLLIERLGFKCTTGQRCLSICSKQMSVYFSRFGFCEAKFIPEEVFDWPVAARKRLMESLLLGDGRKRKQANYCTTSRQLALDVQRLAFTLGMSTTIAFEKDDREDRYLGCWVVHFHTNDERAVQNHQWCRLPYSGKVYCATVPGGLLYVRRRHITPGQRGTPSAHWSGNSLKIGVDARFARNALIGSDHKLYSPFRDVQTGQVRYMAPDQIADSAVAFPGELESGEPYVRALYRGKQTFVPRQQVRFVPTDMESAFTHITNLVPMKSTVKGQRAVMAGRMLTQSLPLKDPESALVQSGVPGSLDDSFDRRLGGDMGAIHADGPARVRAVGEDYIDLDTQQGRKRINLRINDPSNRKTLVHQTPVVQPGDQVQQGQLLARSNYTDEHGTLALGKNLRVAYIPAFDNYEDAYSISESAAKRLTSEHAYQHTLDLGDGVQHGKGRYTSVFPAKFNRRQLETLDDDGVVTKGTVVNPGDPLVLATRDKAPSFASLHSARKVSFDDASEIWEHEGEGIVTDVAKTPTGVNVLVKAYSPMQVGDKLSGRFGDKGVISRIVPDHLMPHDAEGRPYDVLANPLGVISRTNSGQVFEAALGKIAEKTGRPYRVQDFGGIRDMREFVKAELNKYGMKATDTIVDPTNGRKIPRVLAGNRYFLKLHHQSEGKLGGRGTGGYTAEGMPAKGGFGGAKRVSLLSCNALLSHGACFMGSANVLTEDGHLEIAKIVKKRMPVKVACIDMKTGEMVYRPVIDWLCRCVPTSELIKIETNARVEGFRQSRSGHRAIRCTRGHEFYTPGGKVHAGNLKPGDVVYTLGTRLADWQEQFIVGTLLGDGSLTCSEERISGLSQVHGAPQLLYLRWKFAKLRNIANKEPKLGKLSAGSFAKVPTTRFCTRQHPTLDRLGEEFYGSGVKKPPVGIVARAGWLGIGVWFGDDGGCVFSNKLGAITGFRFHTNGFTYDEAETLAQELRDFCGLPWRVIMQNGKYPILHLGKTGGPTGDNLAQWAEMLRPYLPPDMAYKLRVDSCGEAWEGLQPPEGVFLEETTVKSVEPYTPEPYENNLVYNITVAEHHNYVVHGIVVGNTAVLRDAGAFRGQAHADFWTRFMAGHDLPDPQSPMVYDKFFAQLKGAGINVTRDGPKLRLLALTDHDVNELAGDRELQNPETVDWKGGLKPVKGGLFDEGLTGGHGAKGRWAKITLAEPMVSPAFEEPVRRILGLTQQGFKDVVAGRKSLDNLGSGPGAIQAALGRINLDKAINACRADIKSGRKTRRDEAARKIGYLLSAQKLGLHPKDWVLSAVPVLPPAFRPVSVMQGSGIPMVADPNLLYRELWDANENLKSLKGRVDDVSGEREALYNAFKGVVGLGDPIHPKNQEKKVKGLLAHVFGTSPKRGIVQRKLIGATTDLVGRAVISPDPALDMDEVALPENSAWEMYRPFVVRRLVRQGMGHLDAVRAHEKRDDRAKKALMTELEQRPVMVDRAPVLHRYSMMALRPRLTHDNVMKLSPPIVKGFGADFDGDCHHSNVVLTVANDDISRILESCGLTSQDFKDRLVPYSDDTTIPSIRNGNLYLFHLEDFPHGDFFKTTQGQFGPIDWYSVPPGIKVLAQLPNGTLAWSDVSVWSVHRDCEVEIVTLNTGVQIFTDDDPRAVYGIAAGTLELARATPTEAHEQLFLVPRVVRIQDALRSPWDDAPTSRGVTHLGIGRRRLNEEILLDHESGYLIGAMAGNGWGDGRHACLAATDDNVGDKFETCVQRWFVGEAPPRSTRERHADEKGGYGRNRKHTYSSSDLSDLVESCVGHGARNKHLPSWFLNTPREFREGLFAGLMDTDGGVSISHAKKNPQLMVSYTSTSLRLCQEIRLLAASLGIRGSVRSAPTPAGKSGWIVLFSNYDASKWGGKGTVHSTRTAALKSIVVGETPALVRYDLVPISFNLAKACQSSMTYPKDPKKRPPGRQAIYSAFHLATKKGYVTRQSAVRLLDHIDPARRDVLVNHPQWAFWRSIVDNTDVTWDQIESVERTNQTVTGYDLTVPGAETFADADGTILSNTMQFHVPVSDDAAREMLEKMLPSRNLFSPSTFAVHQLPNNEFAGGLYQASTDQAPGEPRQFASRADAMRAYRRGEINYNTPIRILGS